MKMHELVKENLKRLKIESHHVKVRECSIKIGTNHLGSSQYMKVVINKKGEIVEPHFDETTSLKVSKLELVKPSFQRENITPTMEKYVEVFYNLAKFQSDVQSHIWQSKHGGVAKEKSV